jgi:tetratricopeptide (TPR) repeat protein
MNWAPLRALRDGRYKLIDAPRPELYDLETDPAESHNLYAERTQTAAALRQGLERLATAGDAMSLQTLDREAMEKLAALGYIGAGAEPQTGDAKDLADPKDFIALFDRLRQANSAVRERRFDEAIPILKTVLAGDPKNAFATLILGSAYMGQGIEPRGDRAVPPLPRARPHELVRAPVDGDLPRPAGRAGPGPSRGRGRARARPEVHGRARAEGRRARLARRARPPRSPCCARRSPPTRRSPCSGSTSRRSRRGRPPRRGKGGIRDDPELEPTSVPALTGLGAVLAQQGEVAGAEATLRKAIAGDPAAAQARLNLAQLLEKSGRAAEAAAEYRVADDEQRPDAAHRASRYRAASHGVSGDAPHPPKRIRDEARSPARSDPRPNAGAQSARTGSALRTRPGAGCWERSASACRSSRGVVC